MFINIRERGDTIVEVLLAIAVVSTILAGAYVSSNRSFAASQQAQERVEALKYVEGQIEQLKATAEGSSSSTIFGGSAARFFCFNGGHQPQPGLASVALNDPNTDDFTKYVAACSVGTQSRYHLAIERESDDHTFTITAHWDRFKGTVREEIKMVYRVYP